MPGQTKEGLRGACPAGLKVTVAVFPNSLQVTFPFFIPLRTHSSSKPSMLGGVCNPRSSKNWVPIISLQASSGPLGMAQLCMAKF